MYRSGLPKMTPYRSSQKVLSEGLSHSLNQRERSGKGVIPTDLLLTSLLPERFFYSAFDKPR